MGVKDDPIVMVFLRLPAPEVPAVDEIDVHAGEAKLESPVNAQSGRGGPLKGHRSQNATQPESVPEPPVEAGFANGFPASQRGGLTASDRHMNPQAGHRLGQDGQYSQRIRCANRPADVFRQGDRDSQ